MNLESAIKFFSPKSPQLNGAAPATATDSLTISDVMASFGLTGAQAYFGFELFLSKHGITSGERALAMLADYGLRQAHRYPALAGLDDDTKQRLVELLAAFAYQDYARSAASTRQCMCCSGTGFIEAETFTNKTYYPDGRPPKWASCTKGVYPSYWEEVRAKRELVNVRCKSCNGKGEISIACRCHGKGTVLDEEQTRLQGVPVTKTCIKCGGRGYPRLPAEAVRRAAHLYVMRMPQPKWSRHFKPFYEELINQCHAEETAADRMLQRVTRTDKAPMLKR